MQFIFARKPVNAWSEGPESYLDVQYVDDGAFIEPWLGLRPWQVVPLWEYALLRCLGPAALNTAKRDIEGMSDTRLNLWGVLICTESNTSTLPQGKIERSEEFLSSPDCDPGVTRIPIHSFQELRGRVEYWSSRNAALGVEMEFIDRLSVSRSGVCAPKGSMREVRQAYWDFWSSVETISVHMSTASYWGNTSTADMAGALSLEERLSFPDVGEKLAWTGSDATMTQCAAVDYTNSRGRYFRLRIVY